MKQEDKQLLLQDLFARLLYNVCVNVTDRFDETYSKDGILQKIVNYNSDYNGTPFLFGVECQSVPVDITELKPYLRPLSSMTDDEQNEFDEVCDGTLTLYDNEIRCLSIFAWADSFKSILKGIDWLDRKMFDHRIAEGGKTMIEAGLALEAPEEMYNVK